MEQQGISRRSVIKGSVVAGGLVWAAPTLMSSASASHGSHCAVRCQNYCRVKIDPGPGGIYPGPCESSTSSGGFFCVTAIPNDAPAVTCCPGTGTFTVTGKATNPGAGFTITITSPLCKLVSAFAKQGQQCIPATISANCDSATYTGESSHIEFLICCQTS